MSRSLRSLFRRRRGAHVGTPSPAAPRGETIRVRLDRDAVAMGDDMTDNSDVLDVASTSTIDDFLHHEYHLASIMNGRACWIIVRGSRGGAPLGVWAQQWNRSRLLDQSAITVGELAVDGELRLYFEYFAQLDPKKVFQILQGGATDRDALRTVYFTAETEKRIAAELERAALLDTRLLSSEVVAALDILGVTIRAHSDVAVFGVAADREYELRLEDHDGPMVLVQSFDPAQGSNRWMSWFSHPDDAARMLLGRVGEHARELAGLDAYPWPATDYPVGDEWRTHQWRASWTNEGVDRRADFGVGRGIPEPFARTAMLPIETIAVAYRDLG